MRTQLFIGGNWVDGNGTMPVHDPSDGSTITDVATAGDSECDAAVAAASEASASWAKTSPRVRS